MTNENPEGSNTNGAAAVVCTDLLDGNIGKSCDDSGGGGQPLGTVNHSESYLREVYHYPGHASIITQAAKKKGMRFDVSSFKDGEVSYTKDNIMILRGGAAEFLDRLFECGPSRISRKQSALLFLRRHTGILASRCYHAFDLLRRDCSYAHNRKIPSNTRPEWCRAKGVRLQTEPPSRHPLQADSYAPRISFPLLEVLDYLERPDVGLVFEAEAHPYYANHGKPPTRAVAGDAQGSGPNDAQQTESKKEDSSAPEAGQFQATRLIITGKTYELII